jgi:hypothetical protein
VSRESTFSGLGVFPSRGKAGAEKIGTAEGQSNVRITCSSLRRDSEVGLKKRTRSAKPRCLGHLLPCRLSLTLEVNYRTYLFSCPSRSLAVRS